jgi:hypothetical protein
VKLKSGRSLKRVQRYNEQSYEGDDLYESLGLDGTTPILDDDDDM